MANFLRKLKIDEISLVEKGKNPARVTFFKSANPMEKAMDLDQVLAGLSDDARAVIMAALEAAAAPATPAEPAKAEGEEEPKPAEPAPEAAKAEGDEEDPEKKEEELAKAMAKLPIEVRKKLDQAEANEVRISKMEQAEAHRVAVAKAETLRHVPGLKTDDMAKFLKSAAGSMDAASYASLTKVLDSAESAISKSAALGEIGGAGGGAGSAEQEIAAIAKSYREKDPKLTKAGAMVKAATENPQLSAQYRAERNEVR